jgi:hypothetical protein
MAADDTSGARTRESGIPRWAARGGAVLRSGRMIDITLQGAGKNAMSSSLMHGLRQQLAAAAGPRCC